MNATAQVYQQSPLIRIDDQLCKPSLEGGSTLRSLGYERLSIAQQKSAGKLTAKASVPSEIADIFEYVPVTSRHFFTHYQMMPLYPEQQKFVDEFIGTNPLVWNTQYKKGLAWWGMGGGKGVVIPALKTYVDYWLLCLRDPQKFLKQERGAYIDTANVSLNATQARYVYFSAYKDKLRNTINPETGKNIFGENWGIDLSEGHDCLFSIRAEFPKHIRAHSLNSKMYSPEGMRLFFVIIDELGKIPVKAADEMVTFFENNQTKYDPGVAKIVEMTYMQDENDYGAIEAQRAKDDPTMLLSHKAVWEVKPTVTKEHFASQYQKNPVIAAMRYECKKADGIDLSKWLPDYKAFEKCMSGDTPLVDKSSIVRNISAVELWPSFIGVPGIQYFAHVDLATGKTKIGRDAAGFALGHTEEIKTTIDDEYLQRLCSNMGIEVKNETQRKYICNFCGLQYDDVTVKCDGCGNTSFATSEGTKINERLMEIFESHDISTFCNECEHDESGITNRCVKCGGVNLNRYTIEKGVVVDLCMQIISPDMMKAIDLTAVVEFIVMLKEQREFEIELVTYDGWQSLHSLQLLEKAGLKAEILSMDKSREPWDTAEGIINSGAFKVHNNRVLKREVKDAIRKPNGIIDHPDKSKQRALEEGVEEGSKDVLDSVVGVTYNAMRFGTSGSAGIY